MACTACLVCLISTVKKAKAKNTIGKGSTSSRQIKFVQSKFSLDICGQNKAAGLGQ